MSSNFKTMMILYENKYYNKIWTRMSNMLTKFAHIKICLKGLSITANATSKWKFFAGVWMHYMQWTVFAHELLGFWSGWTFWQLLLWNIGQALEIIVAWVTKMRGTKAEIYCYRAAEATFVFQVIHAMFWTILRK